MRAACTDAGNVDRVIRTLKSEGGVVETDTRIVLRTVVARPGPLTK